MIDLPAFVYFCHYHEKLAENRVFGVLLRLNAPESWKATDKQVRFNESSIFVLPPEKFQRKEDLPLHLTPDELLQWALDPTNCPPEHHYLTLSYPLTKLLTVDGAPLRTATRKVYKTWRKLWKFVKSNELVFNVVHKIREHPSYDPSRVMHTSRAGERSAKKLAKRAAPRKQTTQVDLPVGGRSRRSGNRRRRGKRRRKGVAAEARVAYQGNIWTTFDQARYGGGVLELLKSVAYQQWRVGESPLHGFVGTSLCAEAVSAGDCGLDGSAAEQLQSVEVAPENLQASPPDLPLSPAYELERRAFGDWYLFGSEAEADEGIIGEISNYSESASSAAGVDGCGAQVEVEEKEREERTSLCVDFASLWTPPAHSLCASQCQRGADFCFDSRGQLQNCRQGMGEKERQDIHQYDPTTLLGENIHGCSGEVPRDHQSTPCAEVCARSDPDNVRRLDAQSL